MNTDGKINTTKRQRSNGNAEKSSVARLTTEAKARKSSLYTSQAVLDWKEDPKKDPYSPDNEEKRKRNQRALTRRSVSSYKEKLEHRNRNRNSRIPYKRQRGGVGVHVTAKRNEK
jgi:hypothetical protein